MKMHTTGVGQTFGFLHMTVHFFILLTVRTNSAKFEKQTKKMEQVSSLCAYTYTQKHKHTKPHTGTQNL